MILDKTEVREPNIDGEALRVFLKAIDLAGGPQALAQKLLTGVHQGTPPGTILGRLPETLKNPAELLREIKKILEEAKG